MEETAGRVSPAALTPPGAGDILGFPMLRALIALVVLLVALSVSGCSLEDECSSPSGSYGGFCDGDGYLYCRWDSLQGRGRYVFAQCREGYTCKDRVPLTGSTWSQYTALCVWAKAAYPACGTVQGEQACDGKLLIQCDRGYRVSHRLCDSCTTSHGIPSCQGALGDTCDPGPCVQGAVCISYGGAVGHCVAECDCEYEKPCPACARFGSNLTCRVGECRERFLQY